MPKCGSRTSRHYAANWRRRTQESTAGRKKPSATHAKSERRIATVRSSVSAKTFPHNAKGRREAARMILLRWIPFTLERDQDTRARTAGANGKHPVASGTRGLRLARKALEFNLDADAFNFLGRRRRGRSSPAGLPWRCGLDIRRRGSRRQRTLVCTFLLLVPPPLLCPWLALRSPAQG